jgi:hypothetical protein
VHPGEASRLREAALTDDLRNELLTSTPIAVQLYHHTATSEQERRMREENQHYEWSGNAIIKPA